jgi:hypothetical protein
MIYIKITNHIGQEYITEVEETNPATGASLETRRSPAQALKLLYSQIVRREPIECEIVHPNNRARATVLFTNPVTLAVFRDSNN